MIIFKYSERKYIVRYGRLNLDKIVSVKNSKIQEPLNYLNKLTDFETRKVKEKIRNNGIY